jgi:hypothetical protein
MSASTVLDIADKVLYVGDSEETGAKNILLLTKSFIITIVGYKMTCDRPGAS